MFCPHCGVKIQLEKANFCSICGFDLSTIPQADRTESAPVVQLISNDQLSTNVENKPRSSTVIASPAPDPSIKPARKWGWGWYIATGLFWVGSSNSYKDYGNFCDTKFVNSLQLLGLAILVPLYF
jgi:hypothetical protein